jgi:hypothetical protein
MKARSRLLLAALPMFAVAVLALASSCDATSPCSCAPTIQYCAVTISKENGCESEHHCAAIPMDCLTNQTCGCFLPESNPEGHLLTCTSEPTKGFTVYDQSVDC